MVDTLMWLLKAGVQQGLPTSDEKVRGHHDCQLPELIMVVKGGGGKTSLMKVTSV